MTILGPFIFAAFIILPAYFATMEDKEEKTIAVVDSSHLFINNIPETKHLHFKYLENIKFNDIKTVFTQNDYYAVLYISHLIATLDTAKLLLYSEKPPTLDVSMYIENVVAKEIEKGKLETYGITEGIIKDIRKPVIVKSITWSKEGKEKERNMGVLMVVGYISGFLIYFFIFLFGTQVMRGVLEEKTNRIVEVIISSVKPFQLMMGKIIGVGLVALTQFVSWVLLTIFLVSILQAQLLPRQNPSSEQVVAQNVLSSEPVKQSPQPADQNIAQISDALSYLKNIDFTVIIGSFIFYFLAGYLLYAAMFAVIGSISDQDTDIQQFMLPVTIPLILAIFVMINTMNNPESQLSFWFSLIPFTSPIIMMVRIAFGVPYWQVILSMSLLVITFIFMTWLAGKIYRTGILMYGKKITYKELWKWLKYKN